MKTISTVYFLFAIQSVVYAQIKVENMDAGSIGANLRFKGKAEGAYRWNDKNGENFLVLSREANFKSAKQSGNSDAVEYDAELYAYQYTGSKDGKKLVWKLLDFVRNCELDITCQFINGALEITDLDKDGIAETWMMYLLSCRGDASPSILKLIMHEGDKKFAIRGTSRVKTGVSDKGEPEYYGGDQSIDQAFTAGPAVFLEHAKNLWGKFVEEKWD